MTAVCGDQEGIAGCQRDLLVWIGEAKACGALQENHPFIFLLVIPEASRAPVAFGKDAFDADGGCLQDNLKNFLWKFRGEGTESFDFAHLGVQRAQAGLILQSGPEKRPAVFRHGLTEFFCPGRVLDQP
jgi:hypothetical protein